MARTPHAENNVWGLRIDAVGCFFDSFFAALDRGSEKAIVIGQIPSRNSQHHSPNVVLKYAFATWLKVSTLE
jgi:hypothetical protein